MKIEIDVIKNGITYDMSSLVMGVTWNGKNKTAARSLTLKMLDSEAMTEARANVNIGDGAHCIFKLDEQELFRGMFYDLDSSEKPSLSLTAHDNAYRLVRNKDSFSYSNKTATYIFDDVCKRFQIPYRAAPNTGFVIDELPKPKTTGYDVISDALSLTYKTTKKRYSVMCDGDYVTLIRRKNSIVQWVIEPEKNLLSYNYKESIAKTITRAVIYNDDNKIVRSKVNAALENKIGIFQDIDTAKDEMSNSDIQDLINAMLDENGRIQKTLSLKATGITDVISGRGVYIIIPKLGLEKTFYVESDTHTFEKNRHIMSLSLTTATDLDIEDE